MSEAPSDWTWYKRLFGATFAIGLVSGLLSWICSLRPLVDLGPIVGFALLGLTTGSLAGLTIKALAFERVSSRRSWIIILAAAIATSALATVPWAVRSFMRLP